MRTSNPVLSDSTFSVFEAVPQSATMTVQGTVWKTMFLLALAAVSASFTWTTTLNAGVQQAYPWMIGGLIGGLVLALVTAFVPKLAGWTSPFYALAEGLFLGALSAVFEASYPGIAFQAICVTFGTMFTMLVAFQMRLVRATEKFKTGVIAATGGIALVYLASIVMSFFGTTIPYIHEAGWVGIGFSLFVVVIAALNLVLDFDFIERGAANGAPKYLEWYGAFALMVTLVWLYIEVLRLLAKLNSRD